MVGVQSRKTRQKESIRLAFEQMDRPLSIEEALQVAQRQTPTLSVATVYRNINALVEDGWLATISVPGFPSRYELAGKDHHHHFQCNRCKKTFDLEGCSIEAKPALPKGFTASGHELFVYGTCADCRVGA